MSSVDWQEVYAQDGGTAKIADLCEYISGIELDARWDGMHVIVQGNEGLVIGEATASSTREAIALLPDVVQQALRRDLFGD